MRQGAQDVQPSLRVQFLFPCPPLQDFYEPSREPVRQLDDAVGCAQTVRRHGLIRIREDLPKEYWCVAHKQLAETERDSSRTTDLAELHAHGRDDVVRVAYATERRDVAAVCACSERAHKQTTKRRLCQSARTPRVK